MRSCQPSGLYFCRSTSRLWGGECQRSECGFRHLLVPLRFCLEVETKHLNGFECQYAARGLVGVEHKIGQGFILLSCFRAPGCGMVAIRLSSFGDDHHPVLQADDICFDFDSDKCSGIDWCSLKRCSRQKHTLSKASSAKG